MVEIGKELPLSPFGSLVASGNNFDTNLQSAASEDAVQAINFDPPQSSTLSEPECHFCHKKSGDLKRCLGCKKVSYCSKGCQKRHWKLGHKTLCRKD
jgi:hypothetical protein